MLENIKKNKGPLVTLTTVRQFSDKKSHLLDNPRSHINIGIFESLIFKILILQSSATYGEGEKGGNLDYPAPSLLRYLQ